MNHNNRHRLFTGAFLTAFMCMATFAVNEVEDDGHGDVHQESTKVKPVVIDTTHDDDDHGDVHKAEVNNGTSVNQKLQSHL